MLLKIKALIKKIPLSVFIYRLLSRSLHECRKRIKLRELKRKEGHDFYGNSDSNIIVSLTSFPARIEDVWITVETIFQQDYKPWKVVLVLSESEFSGRVLPDSIGKQVKRGLEIIWTDRNTRSYKKLLPVREAYPDAYIVTVDDDIIYEPWRLSGLMAAAKDNPDTVIGYRGWEILLKNGEIMPYALWSPAGKSTPRNRTLLTGVGGVLYPPHILNDDMLFDVDSALELAPTADDIWFWAVARCSGVPVFCLGHEGHMQIHHDDCGNSLSIVNVIGGRNEVQLDAVVKKYELMDLLN
ncbi:glycosyltransferase family A protein [Zobellella iuensis]|uniref:glycosyltransferase family A protein n=1 Tax=Zobellella iuensis TaxID=2803811 RepID=UPI0019217ACF|nr:glycosyltransferase family A protein [Zobellella iuensis]